ncbi:hypothetical protein [Nocardia brasiliensis]|uniref:hypothetical protein n=1 Tax=Nocardia brasiliensis TaxID=37326 RepID=UPI0024584A35|nr:hypothetical protein [Nocardia brasiliensis]
MRSGDQSVPTLSQVQTEWKPWLLNDAGAEIRTRNAEFVTMIDGTVTQIREAGSHWSGDAYYAAYDRVAGDRDNGNKVAQETETLAQALVDGGTTLTGYRQALLDKVTEATAAGFTVSEDWQVTSSGDSSGSDDENLQTHQTAITTALNEMLGTQAGITTAIETASAAVKTRGEQLGDGDPIDNSDSLLSGAPKSTLTQEQVEDDPTTAKDESQPDTQPAGTNPSKLTEVSEKTNGEPKSTEPASTEPASTEPKTTEPASTEPATTEPKSAVPATDTSTSKLTDLSTWKVSDLTSVASAITSVTGNIPTLLESVGKLDDNLADIVKAGGEAGKNLIEASTTGIEKIVDAVDNNAAAPANTPSQPAGDDPTYTDQQPKTPESTDPADKTDGKQPDPKAGDKQPDPKAGDNPETKQEDKPSAKPAEPGSTTPKPDTTAPKADPDAPKSVTQPQSSLMDPGTTSPASYPAAQSPAATSQGSSLFGLPSPTRGDTDQEHRANNYVPQFVQDEVPAPAE